MRKGCSFELAFLDGGVLSPEADPGCWLEGCLGRNYQCPDAGRDVRHRQAASAFDGMSALEEIDRAVDRIKATGVPFAVLQCSSTYPTAAADVGLNVLGDFKRRYATAVGLSDHTATVYPGICAAYLGAQVIEVHLTLSKHAFGPDVAASLTVEELTRLVEGVRFAEDMRRDGVDKTAVSDEAGELRPIFMKSLVAARDLAAGETLSPTTLACRKPGTGIAATRFDEFVGRRLARPLKKHAPLAPEDVEQES